MRRVQSRFVVLYPRARREIARAIESTRAREHASEKKEARALEKFVYDVASRPTR
jgi:hypothetical protein